MTDDEKDDIRTSYINWILEKIQVQPISYLIRTFVYLMSYPQGMSTGLLKLLADMIRDDDDVMPTENELTFDSTESDNDELNDDSTDSLKIQNYDESEFTKENIYNFETEKEQAKISLLACDHCEKVFDLKDELKSHNIEKKCSCNICLKKFVMRMT